MINLKKKLFDFFQVPSVLSFSLAGTFNQDNSRRCKGLDLPEIVICFNPIFIRFIHKDTHVVILVVSRSLRVLKVSCRSGWHNIGISWRFFAFHHRKNILTLDSFFVNKYNTRVITIVGLYRDFFSCRLKLTFILFIPCPPILFYRWENRVWCCFARVVRSHNLGCFFTWRDFAIRIVMVIIMLMV